MKKLILSLTLVGAMGFYASPVMSQGSVGTPGYEEIEYFCGAKQTHICRWNDLASCDVAGQEVCEPGVGG